MRPDQRMCGRMPPGQARCLPLCRVPGGETVGAYPTHPATHAEPIGAGTLSHTLRQGHFDKYSDMTYILRFNHKGFSG
jgi:hypothetical protein